MDSVVKLRILRFKTCGKYYNHCAFNDYNTMFTVVLYYISTFCNVKNDLKVWLHIVCMYSLLQQIIKHSVIVGAFTTLSIRITVRWEVTLCSLVERHKLSEEYVYSMFRIVVRRLQQHTPS